MRWTATAAALMMSGWLSSCGKKANPVVPARTVPQKVERITYRIQGRDLVISWPVPRTNADGSPLTDLKGFRLARGSWPTRDVCTACPPPFQETLWVDLKGPVHPDLEVGPDQVSMRLQRPAAGTTYFFQVKAVNRREREGEASPTLQVAWELPFLPPQAVQLKADPKGLLISWEPSRALLDGSQPEKPALYRLERRTGKGPWEMLGERPLTTTAFIDTGPQEKQSYAYRVKALRQVGTSYLESEASEEKETVYIRPFPPPAVTDLIAFSVPGGVQLRWQGIEEAALSGYHVFRRTQKDKTARRITATPVLERSFEDRKVVSGETYFYSVSAVGAGPAFLEGARSREVEITVAP